jgi:hypothetical protein
MQVRDGGLLGMFPGYKEDGKIQGYIKPKEKTDG